MALVQSLESIDWQEALQDINRRGFSTISEILTQERCQMLIADYEKKKGFRKTVLMARHRFGQGEYKYYDYPLPQIIQEIREQLYPQLVNIANQWMRLLNLDQRFPKSHQELIEICHQHGQNQPTPLILKYEKDGYNTLHQDLYGEIYFPFQAALFLNDLGRDYEGGEFVITEQIPRAQSKAMVLRPKQGDLVIFTTNFRPIKGSRGYYRANMRHGVSEVLTGNRHTLGIIFHDALS